MDQPLIDALELFRSSRKSLGEISEETGVPMIQLEMAVAGRRRNGLHEPALSAMHQRFGTFVRNARMLNLGMSLAQAAQLFGMRKSKLLKIEQGGEDIALSTMTRLATSLGIEIEFTVKDSYDKRSGQKDPDLLADGHPAQEPRSE